MNIRYIIKKYSLFEKHRVYWYFVGRSTDREYYSFNEKHIDLSNRIWKAKAVSVYGLIITIYMGFNKIYLLGMDHDYFLYDKEENMRFYKNSLHQKNELQRTFGDSFYVKEFMRQYHIFSQYMFLEKNYRDKIFNASKRGILKIFRRVDFEDVVGQ